MDRIPLCKAALGPDEHKAVSDALKSGWLTHGPKNEEFEAVFARHIGVKHAICLNSCTSAIFLSLIANKIRGEVILPSFTFVASANAVITAGARPVFADIYYDTCNIDPTSIERLITKNTEAIMLVHYAGQCCEMDAIKQLVEKYKLCLIEDSAETLGGTYKGQKSGSWGIGCFSFFPTKNITTGEGGMITTNDDSLAEKLRAYIGHGMCKTTIKKSQEMRSWRREATYFGYNFRLSNILAAIGVEQMRKLDQLNEKRRQMSKLLTKQLNTLPGVEPPIEKDGNMHVYQMYTIKVSLDYRDNLIIYLKERGIEASVHFDPPVHKQAIFREFHKDSMEITEKIAPSIITLPMFPDITEEEISYISNKIKEFFNQANT